MPTEFKNTIMGKITKSAIINWGENDENGIWFIPTAEQAEAIISEGGLQLGENYYIDYSSSEKATNGKTYGSEIAAIDGLVELVTTSEGLSDENKAALSAQLQSEIYSNSTLSPELATRIQSAFKIKGTAASTLEVLGTIHDNWVKSNGNKFDDPKRSKKLYQFTDLRLMSFGEDGATADLLFLQPILEGAGIEIDLDKLEAEFEAEKSEYMLEHGISDSKGLRDFLRNASENYPILQGLTTSKGKTINPPVVITEELQNPEILERMTEQVAKNLGITYEREVTTDEIREVAETVTLKNLNDVLRDFSNEISNGEKANDNMR